MKEGAPFFDGGLYLGAAVEMIRARDAVLHRRDRKRRARLVEERNVQFSRLGRVAPLRILIEQRLSTHVHRALRAPLTKLVAKRGCAGAVSRISVDAQPAADCA